MASPIVREEGPNPIRVRAVVYGRVSTANNGQDVSMQIQEFNEFCKNRRWGVADEYIDRKTKLARARCVVDCPTIRLTTWAKG